MDMGLETNRKLTVKLQHTVKESVLEFVPGGSDFKNFLDLPKMERILSMDRIPADASLVIPLAVNEWTGTKTLGLHFYQILCGEKKKKKKRKRGKKETRTSDKYSPIVWRELISKQILGT